MVCRMTLEVAEFHGEGKNQIIPICRIYNLQAARKRMQERNRFLVCDARSRDIDNLICAENKYHEIWAF